MNCTICTETVGDGGVHWFRIEGGTGDGEKTEYGVCGPACAGFFYASRLVNLVSHSVKEWKEKPTLIFVETQAGRCVCEVRRCSENREG